MKEEVFTDASKAMYRRELAYERALTAEIDRLRDVLKEIQELSEDDPSLREDDPSGANVLLRLVGRLASQALRSPRPPR